MPWASQIMSTGAVPCPLNHLACGSWLDVTSVVAIRLASRSKATSVERQEGAVTASSQCLLCSVLARRVDDWCSNNRSHVKRWK